MKQVCSIQQVFFKLSQRTINLTALIAIRRGLTNMIPLLLIGSFSIVFTSLPVSGYQKLMERIFGMGWSTFFEIINTSTFGILSIFMVLSISYSYAAIINSRQHSFQLSRIINSCVALCCFIIISCISNDNSSFQILGVTRTFEAIFSAVLASHIFLKLSNSRILRLTSYSDGASATLNEAISAIVPAFITILSFAGLHVLMVSVLGITDLQSEFSMLFTRLSDRIDSPFLTALLFMLAVHSLWFFGLHGSNVLEPITQSFFVSAMVINTSLVEAGAAPTEIFTKTFFDNFVLIGGCGSTLCLLIALFLKGKHRNLRQLAQLSFTPVIFNINEIVTFGMPIVLNPVYLIPFILTPLLFTTISYLAMSTGIVPYTTQVVEWTTPILLSGYASTGSFAGSLLQFFNVVLGVLIYMPFIRIAERLSELQMKRNIRHLSEIVNKQDHQAPDTLISRPDDIGSVARFLTSDLENALRKSKLQLHFQPQTNHEGRVIGIEALLRWDHELFGYIYPPTLIRLAEESGMIDELGFWVFEQACLHKKKLDELGHGNVSVSLNVSAVQLNNINIPDEFQSIITRHGVSPDFLDIEVTEQVALSGSKEILQILKKFHSMGLKISMDDFGMGHSSLMYLKQYVFDTIKLDGSLIHEITTNTSCRDIISSIVYLSESMHFNVIAEYVETEEQKNTLLQLGCRIYQGYLYSPALPFDQLIIYLDNQKNTMPCDPGLRIPEAITL